MAERRQGRAAAERRRSRATAGAAVLWLGLPGIEARRGHVDGVLWEGLSNQIHQRTGELVRLSVTASPTQAGVSLARPLLPAVVVDVLSASEMDMD